MLFAASDEDLAEPPPGQDAGSSGLLTGAEAVAALLRRRGISKVFAYPGTSELSLCDAVVATGEMNLVNARGDKEAVFMAGGGNRVSRDTCAAILHGARGLTNALGAIGDVRRSEVPVLCVVGMASSGSAPFLPPHAEPGLIPKAGVFARAFHDCSEAADADAGRFLGMVTAALGSLDDKPAGPVLLGIPQDVLSKGFVPAAAVESCGWPRPTPVEPDLTEVRQALAEAERPVILVDDYIFAAHPGVEEALGNMAGCLGAPVFQVAYQRGPMLFQQVRPEKVSLSMGPYQPTDPWHREVVRGADLVITVEDRNMYPRVVGSLGGARKIAITSSRDAAAKNGYLGPDGLIIAGDATKIMDRVTSTQTPRTPWHGPEPPPEPAGGATSASGRRLVEAVGTGLAAVGDPALVDDSQMLGGLIAKNYDLLPAGIQVFGSHAGFVGSGLATAVGMATAHPDRTVVCTLGDQGLVNAVQALAVAGELRVPFLVLVCNNGRSVSLCKQSVADGLGAGMSEFLANSSHVDYAALARAFGLDAATVHWPATDDNLLEAAEHLLISRIREALTGGGPCLIEVVTPARPDFWSGVWNVGGIEELGGTESGR